MHVPSRSQLGHEEARHGFGEVSPPGLINLSGPGVPHHAARAAPDRRRAPIKKPGPQARRAESLAQTRMFPRDTSSMAGCSISISNQPEPQKADRLLFSRRKLHKTASRQRCWCPNRARDLAMAEVTATLTQFYTPYGEHLAGHLCQCF